MAYFHVLSLLQVMSNSFLPYLDIQLFSQNFTTAITTQSLAFLELNIISQMQTFRLSATLIELPP